MRLCARKRLSIFTSPRTPVDRSMHTQRTAYGTRPRRSMTPVRGVPEQAHRVPVASCRDPLLLRELPLLRAQRVRPLVSARLHSRVRNGLGMSDCLSRFTGCRLRTSADTTLSFFERVLLAYLHEPIHTGAWYRTNPLLWSGELFAT